MIGKIQRLKNKKGFTLVELIVVIAIIGVLAAILVPLMGDYLTKARATSANSTASSYKTQINSWLQLRSVEGNGRNDGAGLAIYRVNLNGAGNHGVDAPANEENNWGSFTANVDVENAFKARFDEFLSEATTGCFVFSLVGNQCLAVVYSPTTVSNISDLDNYISSTGFVEGIGSDGIAVESSGVRGQLLGSK